MKQISRAEYKNYIIQESISSSSNTKPVDINQQKELHLLGKNQQNEELMSKFFALSTLPSLDVVESKSLRHSEEMYLSELMGKSTNNLPNDPNDANSQVSAAFDAYLAGLGLNNNNNKKSSMNPREVTDEMENDANKDDDDESSMHYITLSSSQVDERLSYNPERNLYVSQLILKHAQVKDSGVYVCLGASSGQTGYTYRKSHLKVVPAIRLPDTIITEQKDQFAGFNFVTQSTQTQPSGFNFQSFGLLIILIPVVLITMFALVSICYLRRLESSRNYQCFPFGPSCLMRKNTNSSTMNKQNQYLCCPTTQGHMLIPDSSTTSTYDPDIEFVKHQIGGVGCGGRPETSLPVNHSSLGSSSLSDSASSSSSTTATTVAYYASIPLLLHDHHHNHNHNQRQLNSPPPPLPQSQPPTFSPPPPQYQHHYQQQQLIEPRLVRSSYQNHNHNQIKQQQQPPQPITRAESTASMAYYKIVDSDMVVGNNNDSKNQIVSNGNDNDDNMTCVSAATSRFYYQLTPQQTTATISR